MPHHLGLWWGTCPTVPYRTLRPRRPMNVVVLALEPQSRTSTPEPPHGRRVECTVRRQSLAPHSNGLRKFDSQWLPILVSPKLSDPCVGDSLTPPMYSYKNIVFRVRVNKFYCGSKIFWFGSRIFWLKYEQILNLLSIHVELKIPLSIANFKACTCTL